MLPKSMPAQSSFSLTTPKGTKVDMKTLHDVVNEVPAEREWTVDGVAPDSGLGIIGGRHKRGKSTKYAPQSKRRGGRTFR